MNIVSSTSDYQGTDNHNSDSSNGWYSDVQGGAFNYYALAGGFNASGQQTSGSSFTYYTNSGSTSSDQWSRNASMYYPTSTYQQTVNGTYSDQEADTGWASSDGSVTGRIQAGSLRGQTTTTSSSLVGTQPFLDGTAVYNNSAINTDVSSTTLITDLGVWPSGAQYGTITGLNTDNSFGSFQVNVQTSLNKGVLSVAQSGDGSNSSQMNDTHLSAFTNSYPPSGFADLCLSCTNWRELLFIAGCYLFICCSFVEICCIL